MADLPADVSSNRLALAFALCSARLPWCHASFSAVIPVPARIGLEYLLTAGFGVIEA
ncbi:MAG TPA: hypothetical protein VG247_18255 [Pseudonocardiaceae bacterium]|jgi:hypothetical protein|nr:hypothetical protein [Pseudonocardiaceae bacterium]